MKENEKIQYVPAEITVVEHLPDIITASVPTSNGFDGELDRW